MSEEILKDLNRVIEKHKDKVFCTGELNYVDMAKSCKLEIKRLNNIINELENYLNKVIETSSKQEKMTCSFVLQYLQELKGDGSNDSKRDV